MSTELLGVSDKEILETYLTNRNIIATAERLGIDVQRVALAVTSPAAILMLNSYTADISDRMYELYASAVDRMEEAELGLTDKDPAEILQMIHKMKMDELKLQIKLAEVQAGKGPNKVSNTQVNIGSGIVQGLPAILKAIREE